MENRFFIGPVSGADFFQILQCVVGGLLDQAISIDGKSVGLRLHKGDTNDYECLRTFKEYTYNEYLEIINSSKWKTSIK